MIGTILCAGAFAVAVSATIWLVIRSIDEFSNCKHFDTKKQKD